MEPMILNGKFSDAKVFTHNIDNVTMSQIIELCNQAFTDGSSIRIMPDCHAGKGCTIGTTMTIDTKVVPNLVGVDIGCGMATVKVSETAFTNFDKLDEIINKHIPHGFATHDRSRESLLKKQFNIDLSKLKCDINYQRAFHSVGTLGGGNHFIEIDKAEDGSLYLTVHTGSRNLGKQIAEYYQKEAITYCKKNYEDHRNATIETYKALGKEHLLSQMLPNMKCPTEDLCYLEGDLLKDYLHDMDIAQRYSAANRLVILADIISHYYEFDFTDTLNRVKLDIIECIHNYIDMNDMILRKGAISAKEGERVIIPINMRDGIILGTGKGNKEWNCSAPHGAGRVLSRGAAKSTIDIKEFEKSMEGIYTTCVGQSTLDEAPQAYKPIEDILQYIGDTIEDIQIIKPVYNFKSH